MIFKMKKEKYMKELNWPQSKAAEEPYDGADENTGRWLGLQYDLTDKEGYFIDFNGQRSFIVHQYDRYGQPLDRWVRKKMPEWVEQSVVSGKKSMNVALK